MMYDEYVVKDGDDIITIAKLYGVRIIDLITENNLEDIYNLEPGMVLKVPIIIPTSLELYEIKPGDTLYQIAKDHNTNMNDLAAINGLELSEYIYPGQKILVPKAGISIYLTKDDDTVNKVLNDLNIEPSELFMYNKNLYLLPEQLIAYNKREI